MNNNNRLILKYCRNFHKIVNFEYYEEDFISEKIISVYEDFIFKVDVNNTEELKKAVELDYVINRYIDDYLFRKNMKSQLLLVRIKKSCDNILKVIVDSIIHIFVKYQEETTRKIYISKWI